MLSGCTHQHLHGPGAIRFLTGVVLEIEFGQVTVEVLLVNMMVHLVDTTLQGGLVAGGSGALESTYHNRPSTSAASIGTWETTTFPSAHCVK